jgi:hypothetical protein
MPGKSRHHRRRQSAWARKRKERQSPIGTIQQQAAVPIHEAAAPKVSAPASSVPISKVTPAVARYPYITGELRRIGILAGIMLVILVVLALVLH